MRIATARLVGLSPYSQSKQVFEPKKSGEKSDAFDKRTWRLHCHTDTKGNVVVPASALKQAISDAAAYKSEKIQGKGSATWTKHFLSGLQVMSSPILMVPEGKDGKAVKADEIDFWEGPCDATPGKRGGARVVRRYPQQDAPWYIDAVFHIFDDDIDVERFERYLEAAGMFKGIGRFRPANGGHNGIFKVEAVAWENVASRAA